MTVKIYIKRKVKQGNLQKVSEMLVQARTNAVGKQGYISSETLQGCDNPNEILVVSMWDKKEDWNRYKDNVSRKEFEAKFAELLEGPTLYAAYNMGLYQ
ncbi:MAG: antibiotic biosynthesis monooxygenase [Proteobacteria bacterium]|nr:antibiotic biosynthesis monooxygenase [Pseudomonadota bacterium]MBU1583296.1 antibiotic biosynthesis monooxygenase [Pseudomonadota bacterium]MBU2454567.1 antibiotic biosynthesis monooxygenase [Pseudomonadota bacterium]MBU2630022.1 antibiotic biosynthesis monooxygenase [Pseudomonadota bacterium]